jgi:hypothetical protein
MEFSGSILPEMLQQLQLLEDLQFTCSCLSNAWLQCNTSSGPCGACRGCA